MGRGGLGVAATVTASFCGCIVSEVSGHVDIRVSRPVYASDSSSVWCIIDIPCG